MSAIPDAQKNGCQLFYCNGKISTEINGDARWRFLQANDLILAQNNHKTPGLPSRHGGMPPAALGILHV
jgi:hypothetical protein